MKKELIGTKSSINKKYNKELRQIIYGLANIGFRDYKNILPRCQGADPNAVISGLKDIGKLPKKIKINSANARQLSSQFFLDLPASNPLYSQWWFDLDSVEKISNEIWKYSNRKKASFIGTPTVGYYYSNCYKQSVTIFDIDKDIINSLKKKKSSLIESINYDVNMELNAKFKKRNSIVFIDPPWYFNYIKLFIKRGLELLSDEGYILLIIPPRMTRPNIIKERNKLLNLLLRNHFEIVSIETNFVYYNCPKFEKNAFNIIKKDLPVIWRPGDLLILHTSASSNIFANKINNPKIKIYSRNPCKLRIFQNNGIFNKKMKSSLKYLRDFEKNVSTRKFNKNKISFWNTQNQAILVNNPRLIENILISWENGNKKKTTIENITKEFENEQNIKEIIIKLEKYLSLWNKEENGIGQNQQEESIKKIINYTTKPNQHEHNFQPDGYRKTFQRDRDRIIWSKSLKRLQNKCQVFSLDNNEILRRRLTHSIEVMQLASTIAEYFKLDPFLTEAGALVHDIGHAPFGHAGEYAINDALNTINKDIGGFNHLEHGLDVVRYLEDVYASPIYRNIFGLNLTPETMECILKHTYYRNKGKNNQSELIENSKHKDIIKDNTCHLEGQAIRIADKISYLISDLEDGVQMGIFTINHFLKCKFFHRNPIDIIPSEDESLYERLLSQRRAILKILMEDIIITTQKNLLRYKNIQDIRRSKTYCIDFSDEIKKEVIEIWNTMQKGILHSHPKIFESNLRASKIINYLIYLYSLYPKTVDQQFRKGHDRLMKNSKYYKYYKNKLKDNGDKIKISKASINHIFLFSIIGEEFKMEKENIFIPLKNIILAKDYVASLSDYTAISEFQKYF